MPTSNSIPKQIHKAPDKVRPEATSGRNHIRCLHVSFLEVGEGHTWVNSRETASTGKKLRARGYGRWPGKNQCRVHRPPRALL